jgi:hypothetical protein
LIALTAFGVAEARNRDAHPFTGENAGKNVITHESGAVTSRATPVSVSHDKYDELVIKSEYKTYTSGYTQAYNHLFGPTAAQKEF